MKLLSNQHGIILPTLIILMTAFSAIGLAITMYTTGQYSRTRNNVFSANALQVAEAGIEQSVAKINETETFTGYTTEQEFFNNTIQGKGVFTTTVANTSDSNAKTITAVGKVFRNGSATKPISTRTIKVTIVGTGSDGSSVITGSGGLILGGAANITNSDVYVRGKIRQTGAASIGTLLNPVNVNVSNIACPAGNTPGPTYPTQCSSGEPISLEWSTFISGTVCATGQTSKGPNIFTPNIRPGLTGGEGLKQGCKAPDTQLPTYDRAAHVAASNQPSSGGTSANNNTYVCNSWPYDRTWPKNLRLNGNVSVDSICNVRLMGNAYITGNLSMAGAAQIVVDDSVGTTRPVILVDGNINANGAFRVVPNRFGTSIHFISFRTNASCNPSCTTLTGNALKASESLETVSVGGGSAILPGTIFQSYWGKVSVGGIGSVGAAAGQTVDLSGAGTVLFGTVLSSGSKSWSVTSYQQIFK